MKIVGDFFGIVNFFYILGNIRAFLRRGLHDLF